jgi:UDP-N-acetylglucosamine diphosphorylase/glucosamine-1-phosphate N-acetyltransferase
MTDLRPSFAVRTGADTTLERIVRVFNLPLAGVRVPDELAGVAREASRVPLLNAYEDDDALLVNGRCPLPDPAWAKLGIGEALVEPGTGAVVAARMTAGDAGSFFRSMELPTDASQQESERQELLNQPWDAVRFRDAAIAVDLMALTDQRPGRKSPFEIAGDHPVWIDPTASIARSAVLDASDGPIRIGAGVTIRHGAIVLGPSSIGDGSTILEHALIKGTTSIGPRCKVAGELDGVIIQGFTNKAHDGHIGDAWLGSWINLGAGTTNSNLLNTYGEVTAQARPDARRVRTGMTFLGSVLGDHVKSSIGTQLMTGAVVGTGSMLASTAPPPACVGRFEWITDAGRSRFRLDKFLQTAGAMLGRREIPLTDAMRSRLAELHAMGAVK